MTETVKLVSVTSPRIEGLTSAEDLLSYCARVSNPSNQMNTKTSAKLLEYCAKHGHWSVFEMASMAVEITTSRGIAQQILRHRSFSFQEFSQRYSEATEFIKYEARRQDKTNRQNSIDDMEEIDRLWFSRAQDSTNYDAIALYNAALKLGIAKEQARFLLPLSTKTTLYMNGNVRSWIHYIQVRADESTQLEHREIALACKDILIKEFPVLEGVL